MVKPDTQVLVVGAGPVGLMAALQLHQRGIRVSIVDQNDRGDARSYAVGLHPRVLQTLIGLGLSETLRFQGCPLKHVTIFSEGEQRAVLKLPAASEVADGGLTLPQNVLRHALERTLHERGIDVRYRHRVVSLETGPRSVQIRLEGSDAWPAAADVDFVVGADGRESTVRKLLGLELVPKGPSETYVFFDVPRDPRAGNQVRLAFTDTFSSAMIPLHGGRMRYAFQVAATPQNPPDPALLHDLLAVRMPWHRDTLERAEWSGVGTFGRAVVNLFGKGRVWLAGDAAHATSPLGVQSLNVGLHEARELAMTLNDCLRAGSPDLLHSRYETHRRAEWNRLLASGPGAPLSPRVPEWVRRHLSQIISALPASGDDLDDLLDQLGVALL
jgi:2-polyprenyl-6-methoxyphenol hydroxylase-like FAD-dependent oxidoreductase